MSARKGRDPIPAVDRVEDRELVEKDERDVALSRTDTSLEGLGCGLLPKVECEVLELLHTSQAAEGRSEQQSAENRTRNDQQKRENPRGPFHATARCVLTAAKASAKTG